MVELPLPESSPPGASAATRQTTDDRPDPRETTAAAVVASSVLVLVGADLVEDISEGVTWSHVGFEAFAALAAAVMLGLAVRRLVHERGRARAMARIAAEVAAYADARASEAETEAATARGDAERAHARAADAASRAHAAEEALARAERLRAEAEAFRAETRDATATVSAAITARFTAWHLTPAERDVARLLLLGLSHKDIAAARDTSERTARDQAQAVYKKAGVEGRAELAAFFLEDLLPPPE